MKKAPPGSIPTSVLDKHGQKQVSIVKCYLQFACSKCSSGVPERLAFPVDAYEEESLVQQCREEMKMGFLLIGGRRESMARVLSCRINKTS